MAKNIYFDADLEDLHLLAKTFPREAYHALGIINKKGREILKNEFLSGQDLNLKKYPLDKKGRHTISGKVINRSRIPAGIRFRSYPLNLFERGRTLRSGKKEPGKKILLGKFANRMNAILPALAKRATDEAFRGLAK